MKRNSSRLRPDTVCTLLLLATLAATCLPTVAQAGEVRSLLKQLKSEDEDYVVRILALRILDELNIPELEQTVAEGRKAESVLRYRRPTGYCSLQM